MSESTGPATVTTEKTLRFRSNGYPMEGTEIMLLNEDEDGVGEVCVRRYACMCVCVHNYLQDLVIFCVLTSS